MTFGKKILVPVDVEDESSKKILNYVTDLSEDAQREIIIMHVVPFNPPYGIIDELASKDAVERSLSKVKLEAENKLIKCLKDAKIGEEKVLVYVVDGDPSEMILKVAEEEKITAIVMGNKCSGISCRIFGSVAFRVIQESSVPVTIIPTN